MLLARLSSPNAMRVARCLPENKEPAVLTSLLYHFIDTATLTSIDEGWRLASVDTLRSWPGTRISPFHRQQATCYTPRRAVCSASGIAPCLWSRISTCGARRPRRRLIRTELPPHGMLRCHKRHVSGLVGLLSCPPARPAEAYLHDGRGECVSAR